ncbi:MAG TPA: DNA mismatch repair endonuclease MutL [Bacteroidales bacterium]|nr:DNA mismatch repair endonuclease MutL [Bacteroidales bacterium]HPS16752.1 DNA mismatch repair endonuclease MutL [Bacteroidales bacterium]
MPDIIHLLPDNVANQIAAGEVVQRPASAVKELLENAIDAGATQIKLIIKDAGKTLIQINDNGCGMSETDARLSFERHATSKIKNASDLFNIRTMGFRGEALASIAAIAQVELKTKRIDDNIGTNIFIEGSEVISQEACQCSEGTSISVKNLFYNVPARRNFLKSNAVETSHILNEFYRVALPFHNIAFDMYHNNSEMHRLPASSLMQRIINIFGNNYNQRLLAVNAETSICKISGYVGKAEHSKKTKGEQFFFVNNRFIKNAYLNHAVVTAFEELLPENSYPSYFLFIDIDTKEIDINIHPTKTEIKFLDEKSIYAIIKAAAKQSLGKFSIDSIDFDIEKSIDILPLKKGEMVKPPTIKINPDYNPFEKNKKDISFSSSGFINKTNKDNWEKIYPTDENIQLKIDHSEKSREDKNSVDTDKNNIIPEVKRKQFIQVNAAYIITQLKTGIMIVDQQNAHEKILFEHFIAHLNNNNFQIKQQQLFPEVIEFNASDSMLIKEIIHDIKAIGFDIDEFGPSSYVINGIPADLQECNTKQILENLLEQYKITGNVPTDEKNIFIAKALAKSLSIKHGKILQQEEMQNLIDQLFAFPSPDKTADGKNTFYIIPFSEMEKKLH